MPSIRDDSAVPVPPGNGVRAAAPAGREYWRSLNELADTAEFRALVEREFPSQASELKNAHSRRAFLQVMGASLSLAGMTGCRWPKETIVPFASRPADRIPGEPDTYATSMEVCGSAQGLLVTSFDGRPTKVEGNPSHPVNGTPGAERARGSADAFAQAGILEMYDPDRSQALIRQDHGRGFPAGWADFEEFATAHFGNLRAAGGTGLHILRESTASPAFEDLRRRVGQAFPAAAWHEYEPVSRDTERTGARLAFGRPVRTHLDLRRARVIVSLDSDFLVQHPASLAYARDFIEGRRYPDAEGRDREMNRLHVVESRYTITGAKADHRYAVPSSAVPAVAARLAAEVLHVLGASGLTADEAGGWIDGLLPAFDRYLEHPFQAPFVSALAQDLVEHRGDCVLLAGPQQPPEVHALVHLLNGALGNTGRTVRYTEEPDPDRSTHAESMRELTSAMRGGQVQTLLLLGGNPVYNAPADLDFARLLETVPMSIHLSLYYDETSKACTWHLPRAHFLESWGDARAWDGTVSMVQPLIEPLYEGRTPIEILALLSGDPVRKGHDLVRRAHRSNSGGDFERHWRTTLREGVVPDSGFAPVEPPLSMASVQSFLSGFDPPPPALGRNSLEIVFHPGTFVFDGRFANNGWLQETPDPLTKLTWDNAAVIGPATASALNLAGGEVVRLSYRGRTLEMPVYIMPGQAPFSVAVALGYGRSSVGRIGNGTGFNTFALRTSEAPGFDSGLTLEPTGRTHKLAITQEHHAIDDIGQKGARERIPTLIREAGIGEFREHPDFAQHFDHHPPLVSLWDEHQYTGHKWGMAIDLTSCIGCSACVVACTAENNVPVVGKERVLEGREMHWIRIDRYFKGDPETAEVKHQPVACVHCENAPCEQVCPVAATVHDSEGLNVMVYNRCIGTRYCSNNCPFKVRRFNFFNYTKGLSPQEKMGKNPDVTVRSRGVMEKCTYCVQRIESVKIQAKNERRAVRDGEIVPACAQTCPTEAIVFGDLNDPGSRVAKLHAQPHSYALLSELNIKPRTRYMARLNNALAEPASGGPAHGDPGHPKPDGHEGGEPQQEGHPVQREGS